MPPTSIPERGKRMAALFPGFLLPAVFFLLLPAAALFAQEPRLILPIGHTAHITSFQLSPDRKTLASAAADKTVKVWDVFTGRMLLDLEGHRGKVNAVTYSHDNRLLASASDDSTVNIWEAGTGALLQTLKGHRNRVSTVALSADDARVLTGSMDRTARLWDRRTGTVLAAFLGHKDIVYSAAFSPDEKKVLTASQDGTAKIWESAGGKLLFSLDAHTGNVRSAEFSPDGKKVVTASGDSTARVWDAATGTLLVTLKGHRDEVNSAHFSPDGKKVLTASNDRTAKIWDAATGKLLVNLADHIHWVFLAIFSPDGSTVLTTSGGYRKEQVRLWDAATGQLKTVCAPPLNSIKVAAFSPSGNSVIGGSYDGSISVWSTDKGALYLYLDGFVSSNSKARFSPDGKRILTCPYDGTAKIWEAATGRLLTTLRGHAGAVVSPVFSPDGKKILTPSFDGTARLWNAESGDSLLTLKGHTEMLTEGLFSADGNKIVTASYDRTARVWNARTGKLLVTLPLGDIMLSMAVSPDGKTLATSTFHKKYIQVWDAETGKLLKELTDMEGSQTNSLAFSRRGDYLLANTGARPRIWHLASAAVVFEAAKEAPYHYNSVGFSPDESRLLLSYDDFIQLCDWKGGKTLLELKKGKEPFGSAVFSPDGTKILAGTDSGELGMWEAATGRPLAAFKGHRNFVTALSFSPDGQAVLTAAADNTCKLWKASGELLYSFFALGYSDYLVQDRHHRYDGTEGARRLLYFTCGSEVVELEQVKDQLWVPHLAERIMRGETLSGPRLSDLTLCNFIPEVQNLQEKEGYRFRIRPRAGGLGETVLLVNGIEVKRYRPEQLSAVARDYELKLSAAELQPYFIAGQQNAVMVKAYTAKGSISSRGNVVLHNEQEKTATPPNLFAVMVGVSDYKGEELDLKYAAKDAADMGRAVAASARKLLNTDGREHVFVYGLHTEKDGRALPEKAAIRAVFEEIGKKATAADIILVFFAGHGVMEGEQKQFYFLTADASKATAAGAPADVGISTRELGEWLKPSAIRAQKRILVFDACNSGQAINELVKIGSEGQHYLAARSDDHTQQVKAIEKLNERSGLFILSASASNQSAYEMGRYAQGLLTYALLKAIREQPDILEENKYLSVSRWFNAAEKTVSDVVRETGNRQQPQVVSTSNFAIGIVDDEVVNAIRLPQQKPLFASARLINKDEAVLDDDAGISRLIDEQLTAFSARGAEAAIAFSSHASVTDAYTLSGSYTVTGNRIQCRVNLRKNKATLYSFEAPGSLDALPKLAADIAGKATDWVKGKR